MAATSTNKKNVITTFYHRSSGRKHHNNSPSTTPLLLILLLSFSFYDPESSLAAALTLSPLLSTNVFTTASEKPVCRYALGGAARSTQSKNLPLTYATLLQDNDNESGAATAKNNNPAPFYFYYNPHRYPAFMNGIKNICNNNNHEDEKKYHHREDIFIASGGTDRSYDGMEQRLNDALQYSGGKYLDLFVLEYVCHGENDDIEQAMKQIRKWKERGAVRYVAASTHSHEIGARLASRYGGGGSGGDLDALMLRYNMAHRAAAEQLSFPACVKYNVPVVAFTTTRWNALQDGHDDWKTTDDNDNDNDDGGGTATTAVSEGQLVPPTTGECLSFALGASPPVEIVLHSARDEEELEEALRGLKKGLSNDDVVKWKKYGGLNWNVIDEFDEYPEEQFMMLAS